MSDPGLSWPDETEILDLLVSGAVISPDRLVDEGLTIESSGRRNRNLRICWPDGSGYLVKVPDPRSAMSVRTLRAEADFYHAAAESAVGGGRRNATDGVRGSALENMLVALLQDDPARGLVVLELAKDHHSLTDEIARAEPGTFPIAVHAHVACLLARLHAVDVQSLGSRPISPQVAPVADFTRPDPWVLGHATPATLLVLEMVQDLPSFADGFAELVAGWRPSTLVHGDMRPDNVLVRHDRGGAVDVRIVDWELWHIGDPAQDLAGLLAAVVAATVGEAVDPSGRYDEPPGWDLTEAGIVLQATAASVWRSYAIERGLDGEERAHLARRTAGYVAARLVQGVMETADQAGAITDQGMALLEIAANVFADPDRAATELLGLSLPPR